MPGYFGLPNRAGRQRDLESKRSDRMDVQPLEDICAPYLRFTFLWRVLFFVTDWDLLAPLPRPADLPFQGRRPPRPEPGVPQRSTPLTPACFRFARWPAPASSGFPVRPRLPRQPNVQLASPYLPRSRTGRNSY